MMNEALLRTARETDCAIGGRSPKFARPSASRELKSVSTREREGGSFPPVLSFEFRHRPLVGTAAQIEWADSIRMRVNDEFDRVARIFRSVARRQSTGSRSKTEAIIAILEDKRAEVLGREQAGYFIHDWHEISDQVRQMIRADHRYAAINGRKAADGYANRDRA